MSNIDNLISRKILFSNPDHASPKISFDGKNLAYLAPCDGVLNIWTSDVLSINTPRPLTFDKGRGINSFSWLYTNQHIVYRQDTDGDENWRIFLIDIETGQCECLTPQDKVQARIEVISHKHPEKIAISMNNRLPELHDYYVVDIFTKKLSPLFENPGFVGVMFDDDFCVRFASQVREDGGVKTLQFKDGAWSNFMDVEPEDAMTTSIIGFANEQNTNIYMMDSRHRDTSCLMLYDLEKNSSTLLAFDNRADGDDIKIHPSTKKLQAYAVNYMTKTWSYFDKEFENDIKFLENNIAYHAEVISRSHDDTLWVVAFLQDTGPIAYYLFDRLSRESQFLFYNRQSLSEYRLQPMEAVEIEARDGLKLVCYITKPFGANGAAPYVLNIHGGPRARDSWGYDPIHQWLANRGYGVISINYRGSTGFGKKFLNAGNGQWSKAMHDDIIDVANWAIGKGLALKDKIGIMGGSYGGYATLVGLTLTPDFFACGIDIVGPSNLETLVKSVPEYWRPVLDMMKVMLGCDFDTHEGKEFLRSISPLTYHENIKKPLLIAQGATDPRVKRAESDQIVSALERKNIPVTYLLYPNEGHGFARPENRSSFYCVAEAFLCKVLGGRFEKVQNDFNNSSMLIEAGNNYVDDLLKQSNIERV